MENYTHDNDKNKRENTQVGYLSLHNTSLPPLHFIPFTEAYHNRIYINRTRHKGKKSRYSSSTTVGCQYSRWGVSRKYYRMGQATNYTSEE